jgi:hypothetical protein
MISAYKWFILVFDIYKRMSNLNAIKLFSTKIKFAGNQHIYLNGNTSLLL